MATNVNLENLVQKAMKAGGHRTKKAAVTTALEEYVRRHHQKKIESVFDQIDYDPAYDYKRERRRR
jgi:Arc/MetJ family transcription regulator